DFGLAGLGGADADDVNPRTIDYAGLERSTNVRKDDARSDIFFVGSIYYQLLSGRPALSETRERAQRLAKSRFKDIKPINTVAPDVPLALARVVGKALEFDPNRRYQTPGEMLADLKLAAKRVAEGVGGSVETEQAGKKLEGHNEQGESRRLMIVESDVKMQDLFRKLFKTCGYRVLVTSSPDRIFESLYTDASSIDILLICTGEIGEEALEAFNRLGHETATKHLPAVLLLGDQHMSWASKVETSPHHLAVKMPVKSKQLRAALLKANNAAASVA
ncbi:MAG: serine/threonine protein kinase, partial [Lacipirellulaceae bacterium]